MECARFNSDERSGGNAARGTHTHPLGALQPSGASRRLARLQVGVPLTYHSFRYPIAEAMAEFADGVKTAA